MLLSVTWITQLICLDRFCPELRTTVLVQHWVFEFWPERNISTRSDRADEFVPEVGRSSAGTWPEKPCLARKLGIFTKSAKRPAVSGRLMMDPCLATGVHKASCTFPPCMPTLSASLEWLSHHFCWNAPRNTCALYVAWWSSDAVCFGTGMYSVLSVCPSLSLSLSLRLN